MHIFYLILPLLALILDYLLKDPRGLPHPVQAIGFLARRLEVWARRFARGPQQVLSGESLDPESTGEHAENGRLVCIPGIAELNAGYVAGALALCGVLLATGLVVFLLMHLPGPRWLSYLLALYLAYAGLALGSLLREGQRALEALQAVEEAEAAGVDIEPKLARAREAVGGLVSRDLSQAGRSDLYRALAETLSENFNDALVAPFFWLLLGGPIGLWLYKAVSTMDSLWGYLTPQWRYLGFASARLDDALAFIPARLSAMLLGLASFIAPCKGQWPGWSIVGQDAAQMASPNAGWPMSAAAWLHGANMGGATVYFGETLQKPILGPRQSGEGGLSPLLGWDGAKIKDLLCHLRLTGLLGCALMWLVWVLFAVGLAFLSLCKLCYFAF